MESSASDYSGKISSLHSRYNPQAEAQKYIDSLEFKNGIEYIILLEPGLGYLVKPLKNRLSTAKIVALHADSILRSHAHKNTDIPAWYPDCPETIQEFLQREIPDTPASAIQIVEWRPGLMVYGTKYLNILSETVEYIKRSDAGARTVAGFGRRWLKNFFKNLKLISGILLFKPGDIPLLITGSGPGLEEALPHIREIKSQTLIIASSSSLLALRQGGINPGLIITTDGGAWAYYHLHSCMRETMPVYGLAINLCAALPSQCGQYPFLVLNDGSLWQTLVLSGLGIPSIIIGQRGTVSATALELALEFGRGNIYLAGVDLCVKDIRTHARPHGFDHILYGLTNRCDPLYSRCFKRAHGITDGKSLEIYAAWFRDRLKRLPNRIYTLDTHNAVFKKADGVSSSYNQEADNNSAPADFFKIHTVNGNPEQFCMQAVNILCQALDSPRYSAALCSELSELLFPGKKNIKAGEIKGELKNFARQYGGKNG